MLLRARRLGLIASAASLAAGVMTAVVPAAVASPNPPAVQTNPYSPAYGHPYRHGVVPTTGQQRKIKAYQAAHPSSTGATTSSQTLAYGGGGTNGIGVTSGTPKVYLVFWGSQWGAQNTDANNNLTFSGDPDGGAPYIQQMFKGLGTGTETWSGVMTQYCDGAVASGATSCPAGASYVGYPLGGAFAGAWYDGSASEPSPATEDQIAQEAINAAHHFGNTTKASNRFVQYFVLSAPGTNPDNYLTSNFCAWHDYNADPALTGGPVNSPYGDIAFTNMPYVMDAGAGCGQGAVNNPGTLDGYSIVGGHEYAETITDQEPVDGWSNARSGNENGDDCAWITGGPGAMADVTLATGSFAMQSTWSNDTNQCAMSHPLYSTMTLVSGNSQSAVVGSAFATPLEVNVSNSNGPVSGLSVTFTAPSSGATVTFASPCSGQTCTVTTDASGNATVPGLTAGSAAGSMTVKTSARYVTTTPSFTLYNLAGGPAAMAIVSGSSQSAPVGSAYASPLVVKVTDSSGNATPGVSVTFSAPASGASATFGSCPGGNPPNSCVVPTDSQGDATSSALSADTTLGAFNVTAAVSGVVPQTFSLTNIVGPAAALNTIGGGGQQTLAAGRFASPVSVQVVDRYGNPVPGARVTFSAPASGPSATFGACAAGNPSARQCVVATDAAGHATSSALTAGISPGAFDVQAVVSGAPAVQFAETVAQSGYWTVASDGGIFSFGGAPFGGSEGGHPLNKPIVGMAPAPGGGYYMVASDGGIFSFGGAPFYGSQGGQPLNKPIVGMAAVPGGYYLVASDGGIFSFGPGAKFYGSEGGQPLNKPIVGMAAALGGGYYLVASDGGIFTFGPGAAFQGSMGGHPLNKPIVGMSVDPATGGYWLDASDGGIFAFNAPFYGSMGGTPLNQPMVGMAPSALIPG